MERSHRPHSGTQRARRPAASSASSLSNCGSGLSAGRRFASALHFSTSTAIILGHYLRAYGSAAWNGGDPGKAGRKAARNCFAKKIESSPRKLRKFQEGEAVMEATITNAGKNLEHGIVKTARYLDSKKGQRALGRVGFAAAGIAALCMVRGYLIPKDPYLHLSITADPPGIEKKHTPPPAEFKGEVIPVTAVKNIPAGLVVCKDREQFDIVKTDIETIQSGSSNIETVAVSLKTPIEPDSSELRTLSPQDASDAMYVFRYHQERSDLRSSTIFILINGESCTLDMIHQAAEQLHVPATFKYIAFRGHNYQMSPLADSIKARKLADPECLLFYGGCECSQYVRSDASANMPIMTTEATGYARSNNNAMLSTVSALNRSTTNGWEDLKSNIRAENPLSGHYFVVPGTSEYRALFSQRRH